MRKNINRVLALGLTGVLVASMITGNAEYVQHSYAVKTAVKEAVKVTQGKVEEKESGGTDSTELSKQETVYVNMDASGNTKDVVVSDWLKNSGISGEINDVSNLTDIENVKGDETFEQDGEDLTWQAGDQDIYYQGKTDKDLPVGVSLTYKLDGVKVNPEDIVGKSGKLEIDIKYINNSKKSVSLAGEKTDIYTPFVMVTGTIFPVENFENITIDHGTVVSEGDNNIVVGYGVPGLKESLDLDNQDISEDLDLNTSKLTKKLTDTVKIKADVTDFEMKSTYTVATNQMFNEFDMDEAEDTDELTDKIDDLEEASSKLVDGTQKLQDGTQALEDNFSTYADGVDSAKDGVSELKKGSSSLKKGVSGYTKGTDKLLKGVNSYVKGTKSLSKGVQAYTAGTSQLVDAVSQLRSGTKDLPAQYAQLGDGIDKYVASVNQLLAKENMDQLADGAKSLKEGIGQLDDGLTAAKTGVATINAAAGQLKQSDQLDACVAGLQALLAQYTAAAQAAPDEETAAQAKQAAAALTGAIQYIQGGEQAAAALDAATNGKADGELDKNGSSDLAAALATMQAATDKSAAGKNLYTGAAALEQAAGTMSGYAAQIRDGSKALTDGNAQMKAGLSQVTDSIGQINDGAGKLTENNASLNKGADKLIKNGTLITKNARKLTKNSAALRNGAGQLNQGTGKLFAGMTKLINATGKVSNGISKLNDGAGTLSNGMDKFNDKGIHKITDAVSELIDGAEDFNDRLTKISNQSKDYTSFSGKSSKMDGSVKFIMATEGVTAEEED